jgi:excisionase family DNA binding protein
MAVKMRNIHCGIHLEEKTTKITNKPITACQNCKREFIQTRRWQKFCDRNCKDIFWGELRKKVTSELLARNNTLEDTNDLHSFHSHNLDTGTRIMINNKALPMPVGLRIHSRRIKMDKKVNQPVNAIPMKRLYSIKDAAVYLGRSEWAVREMVWGGKLPYIRDGRRILLALEDMNAWIERSKTEFTF